MRTKKKQSPIFHRQETITLIILVLLVIITAFIQKNFFKPAVLNNTFISWVPVILLTMGQSIVIIAGGLDMSSGAAFSMMLCVMAKIMKESDPMTGIAALIVCFLTMCAIGLVNGLAVGYFKLPPIIATFATSYIFLGIALLVMPSPGGECVNWMRIFYSFKTIDNGPAWMKNFTMTNGVFLVLIACIIWYFIKRSKIGRYIYAVGSNRHVAFDSGINTVRVQIVAYILNALFIMLAALFMIGQNKTGSARIGDPLTLQSVASAAIGGVALTGGRGNVFMSICGAVIIQLVSKIIFFSGISTDFQTIVSGIILIAAVSVSGFIDLFSSINKVNQKETV